MNNKARKRLWMALGFLMAFVLWTLVLGAVDVQPIGPNGTQVGFATINGYVHRMTGVNMTIYTVTDWLGLVPVAIGFGFAVLGLVQWICRKSIRKVDFDLWVLGGFCLLMLAVYLLFESVVINYRPVLIHGFLEVSYPSSTTLLVLCVMPTTMLQLHRRLQHRLLRRVLQTIIVLFMLFMVIGRLLAGVHWLTDIIGGVLLAGGMVLLYDAVCLFKTE